MRVRFAIFDVLVGKLAWKLGFLVPNPFELKEAIRAYNSNKCLSSYDIRVYVQPNDIHNLDTVVRGSPHNVYE